MFFLPETNELFDHLFANFDRPFKEIDQYKVYKSNDKGYLVVINALGLDKESVKVTYEKNVYSQGRGVIPVLKIIGQKKNKVTGIEYKINLGIDLTPIKEEIEGVLYDCTDGVCVINIKTKVDSKAIVEGKEMPKDFTWFDK